MVRHSTLLALCTALLISCGGRTQPTVAPGPVDYGALVAAPDRSDADKALDAGRHPTELLALLDVRGGQHVAELQAGGGYTSELLARAVGPTGKVYAQNNAGVLGFAGAAWQARLDRLAAPQLVRVDRELDAPLPPEARDLDLVVSSLTYHDAVGYGDDRAKMNAAVRAALKPTGRYIVIDHAALPDAPMPEVTKTLHRIPEAFVIAEVEAAGFTLAERSASFANPGDSHDWSAAPSAAGERRGTSDRFALVFTKK